MIFAFELFLLFFRSLENDAFVIFAARLADATAFDDNRKRDT